MILKSRKMKETDVLINQHLVDYIIVIIVTFFATTTPMTRKAIIFFIIANLSWHRFYEHDIIGWSHCCVWLHCDRGTVGRYERSMEMDICSWSCPSQSRTYPNFVDSFRRKIFGGWIWTISVRTILYEMSVLLFCRTENKWKMSYLIEIFIIF